MRTAAVSAALAIALVGAGCGTVLGTFDVSEDGGPTATSEGGAKTGDGGVSADGSSSGKDSGTGITPGEGGVVEAGSPGGTPCTIDTKGQSPECNAAEYCLSTDCKTGTCMHIPVAETNTNFDPVCGCNGVDFYNQQIAARHGQSSKSGACAVGVPCATGKCPLTGANLGCWAAVSTCSGAAVAMVCMGLPASCPDTPKYTGCSKGCAPVCSLIQDSSPYQAIACN
jgi:hypothetical protein